MDPEAASHKRIRITVGGKVKRVRFRLFVKQQAEALGLVGWVRNRLGNCVDVVAEGPPSRLERLSSLVQTGPPSAEVQWAKVEWGEPVGRLRGFRIRWLGFM